MHAGRLAFTRVYTHARSHVLMHIYVCNSGLVYTHITHAQTKATKYTQYVRVEPINYMDIFCYKIHTSYYE